MALSWAGNFVLLVLKIIAFALSGSEAVLASVVDSAVDILTQAVLGGASWMVNQHHPHYPIGRNRLRTVSVLACAVIMIICSVEIIRIAVESIQEGMGGHIPALDMSPLIYGILAAVIFVKLFNYFLCMASFARDKLDDIKALAEDHYNDVISNAATIVTASVAFEVRKVWWIDPAGAILISLYIIVRWVFILSDEVEKLVGHQAPVEFRKEIEGLVTNFDPKVKLDASRIYFSGGRIIAEVDILLPRQTPLAEASELSRALLQKIEAYDEIERAHVHVDYLPRAETLHKVERQFAL